MDWVDKPQNYNCNIYNKYNYVLVEEKNTLLSLQACFVIAHSSGDFNDKNIPNHHLNTIRII